MKRDQHRLPISPRVQGGSNRYGPSRLLIRLVALPLVVLLAGPLQAAEPVSVTTPVDDPQRWLMEMNRAFSEQSYDGSFSFFNGSDVASLRVVHMVVDGLQHERLVHLNGAPREIVRQGEAVSCIVEPGDDLIEMEKNMPVGPFARAFVREFSRIADSYSLAFFGTERIAGRTARRIAVSPKDNHRFGYQLWLDEETKLLLRSVLFNKDGKRLEIFQFVSLEIGDAVSPKALEPEATEGSMVSHLSLAAEGGQPRTPQVVPWHAGWVPAGFGMAASEQRHRKDDLAAVSTLVYSDGVAAFSVFVEDMPSVGASNMVSRNGATVAVSQLRKGDQGKHLVTVVGEIPTPTARRIAQSVQPANLSGAR